MIIAISLLLTGSILPITASALTDDNGSENQIALGDEMLKSEKLTLSDKAVLRAEDPEISEESMILKYIDSSQFNAAKHVQRLTELEDLNTYVFANADGTRSIYMIHENVKYVDEDGTVREKDISLESRTGGFGIAQSNVELLIPNKPVQGIDIEYSGFAIKLIPQGLTNIVSAAQSDNSVVYDEAYGENTKLVYTPMLSGIKEDVVLSEYTDNATYSFILETDGLFVYNGDSGYYLADGDKAEPIFYLGEIVIYDAVGKPAEGTMTVEEVTAGEKYLLTVTADDDFLSDPTTVYPVTIDPSITVSDSDTGGSIIDAPIFAGYPNKNFGSYIYNRVGTPSGGYGIGRTVVKLSGLTSSNEYQTITANQITNVTFYAKEASGGKSQYINIYPLTSNTSWTETSVTWNNIGSYDTSVNYGNTMSGGKWTAFDITNLAKAWKNETYSASAGFIMTNEDETRDKCFLSSEYSNSSYWPYVTMTYEPTFCGGDSFDNAEVITLNTYHTVNIDTQYELKYFKFVPSATGFYTFECTSKLSGDPYGRLYNSSESQIAYDDDGASNLKFRLTYHLMSGVTYYFSAGCCGTTASIYDFKIVKTTSSSHISTTTLNIGSQSSVSIDLPYKARVYKFTPTVTGEYQFISSDSTGDPIVWCYDSALNFVDSNDDGAGSMNFKLTVNLDYGKTYYIVANHFLSRTGNYKITPYRSLSYVHYYDSSFASNATLRGNISIANTFADYVYSNYFGIKMNMSASASQYATVLDDCTTGTGNYCTTTSCGSTCNYVHHKNIYTIAQQIYSAPRADNHLYVLWTNRAYGTTYCYTKNGSHTPYEAIAVVIGKKPVIHFLNIYGDTNTQQLACMAVCLVHETAHTLKMNDVYDNEGHDITGETICVMERFDKRTAYEFYQDVLNGVADPFCDSCEQTMIGLTTSTSIKGNQ
jgi:hypothetical protein